MYKVNDIYPTVQGEGCQTGVAMILLRLHGCGVGCPWCDTKETWAVDEQNRRTSLHDALGVSPLWVELSGSEIAAYIRRVYGRNAQGEKTGPQWVLLTGGEPADQDLQGLVVALHDAGYKVAIETSGTANGHTKAGADWVCVSPKIGMPGGRAILPEVVAAADEIKMVVGKAADLEKLEELLSSCNVNQERTAICLQPLSLSEKATALCIVTVQRRGWRLSIQTHKFLNLP